MAGLAFTATNAAGGVTVVATTADTILQIVAAANHPVIVDAIVVSFNGITPADTPITVDLVLQSDAGSGGTAVTCVKTNQSMSETLQTTAIRGPTSEPTGTTIYHTEFVHEQGGVPLLIPKGVFVIKGGERLGIRMTGGATVTGTVLARATFYGQE